MGGKSEDPNKAAMDLQREQMKRLDALELPELEEYILQNPELVGLLEAEMLDPSAMEDISTDPRLKESQMEALAGLRDRSEQGITAQDKMAMEEMLGQVGAQEKSQRAAIEQEMQRKGTADSGTSLMSKLKGVQGGANSSRQRAMQMAAQGQQQRMAALQGMGQMAEQMEGQDWQRQLQQASAKDAIAKANAMNRQNVNSINLSARQMNENQRAAIANQQAQVGNQIAQQNYNNAYSRTGAQGSVTNAMSNIAANAPQRPDALQAGLQGGISGFAATGNPYGAAAGAGIGILSSYMEDGGIARSQDQENKAHEKFKREYMKRVRGELAPQKDAIEEVTGVVHAEGGLNVPEDITGQQDNNFKFDTPTFDPVSATDKVEATLKSPDILQKPKERDVLQEAVEETQLAPQESFFGKEEGSEGMSKESMQGIAKMASKMLGGQQDRKKLNLGSYSQPDITNSLTPIQAQKFGNAFQGARFEDGGLTPLQELARLRNPAYACGGIHSGTKKAEDGNIMFDSQGDGAVVGGDSFERDRVDARLNSGEAVLNVAQQQRLMDILRGEESVDNLGEDDIVEGVPSEYQNKLTDEIDNGEDMKVKGLQKLLSALGEK